MGSISRLEAARTEMSARHHPEELLMPLPYLSTMIFLPLLGMVIILCLRKEQENKK